MPHGQRGIAHFVLGKQTKFLTASLSHVFFRGIVLWRGAQKNGRSKKAASMDEILILPSCVLHLAALDQQRIDSLC
jgi:hypothetical protein